MDQLNPQKFAFIATPGYTDHIRTFQIIDNNVQLKTKFGMTRDLICRKLMGNKMCGLFFHEIENEKSIEYLEYELKENGETEMLMKQLILNVCEFENANFFVSFKRRFS